MQKLKRRGVVVVKGLGLAAGLLVASGGCDCPDDSAYYCPGSGEYTLTVTYINQDVDNVHLYRLPDIAADTNRLVPGGVRYGSSTGEFFPMMIYCTDIPSERDRGSEECQNAQEAAAAAPQTWTFVASRGEQMLGTETLVLNFDLVNNPDREVRVTVTWNGASLSVLLP